MDIGVGDVVEVKTICSLGLQLSFNITHYRIVSETVVTGHLQDGEIAATFGAFNNSLIAPLIVAHAQTEGATAQIIRPTPHPFAYSINQSGGTGIGDSMAKQTAGVVTKLTTGIGRAKRGRFYIPFPAEGNNDSAGRPDAAYQALAATMGNGLFTAPFTVTGIKGSAVLQPVIYHRATGTTDDIVGFAVRTKWGTQRRRGDFGAINQLPWVNLV